MSDHSTTPYGWENAVEPGSFGYLARTGLEELQALGVRRVVDLGCGDGALCGFWQRAVLKVVGVEYDCDGVERARRSHPGISVHCLLVGDDSAPVPSGGEQSDAAISTELVDRLYASSQLPQLIAQLLLKDAHPPVLVMVCCAPSNVRYVH